MKEKKINGNIKHGIFVFSLCVMGGLATGIARAADYTWLPTDWSDYSDKANWKSGDVTPVEELPGGSDSIALNSGRAMKFDLGGGEYSWKGGDGSAGTTFHITNGTMRLVGDLKMRIYGLTLYSDTHFIVTGSCNLEPGIWESGTVKVNIKRDATLTFADTSKLNFDYNSFVTVDAGGTLEFLSPGAIALNQAANKKGITNNGKWLIPNGCKIVADPNKATLEIKQTSTGYMELGGDFDSNGKGGTYTLTFEGGTLKCAGDAKFNLTSVSIKPNATLGVEVTNGKTLDLSSVTVGAGATVNKSGAGTLQISSFSGTVADGIVEASTYGDLTFTGGSVIVSANEDGTMPALPSVAVGANARVKIKLVNLGRLDDGNYTIVTAGAGLGETDYEFEADDTVKTVFTVGANGLVVMAKAFKAATFNGGADGLISDLSNASGWAGGRAAGDDEDVIISATAAITAETADYRSIELSETAQVTVDATRDLNNITMDGGATLAIADGAGVTVKGVFSAIGNGSVFVNVAAGCTLDLRGVTLATDAKLVKSGAGLIIFDQTTLDNVEIAAGSIALPSGVALDIAGLTVAEGAQTVVLNDAGAVRPSTGVYDSGTGLTTYYAPGYYQGVGTWNTAANWLSGEPTGTETAHIIGEGTVLTIDRVVDLPAAFVVEDGATLHVTADLVLPLITLAPTAAFRVGDTETQSACTCQLTAALETSFSEVDGAISISKLTIAPKAVLKVPGGTSLKNIDLENSGKLEADPAGHLTIGYADNQETSYLKVTGNGGTFTSNPWDPGVDGKTLNFVYPQSGGRVKVLAPITLTNCTLVPCSSWGTYCSVHIGENNPVDEVFDFVIEGKEVQFTYDVQFGGGARVKCANGGGIGYAWSTSHLDLWRATRIMGAAVLELDGCAFTKKVAYRHAKFEPTTDGHESLILKNGGSIWGSRVSGNNKAVVRVENAGIWTVPKMNSNYALDDYSVLNGFKSAAVSEGGVLRIVGSSVGTSQSATWTDWDRTVEVKAPITGAGDLTAENEVAANSMRVTLTKANNTCTGKVFCEGVNDTKILFADGANWAGTVVAGEGVALGGDAPATVSFGTLDLSGDFPIRYWKTAEGAVTCDRIDLGAVVANGGKLVFAAQDDAAAIVPTDRLIIGSLPKSAAAVLPKVMKGWRVRAVDDPADATRVLLRADTMVGFSISFR